jgi:formylglycine-generating enzyme required for sulfatase activity
MNLTSQLGRAPAIVFGSLALFSTAEAQVVPYGSGINPPGSLSVLSGIAAAGETVTFAVANTAVSTAPPGVAFVLVTATPAPGFPNGLALPGFGMAAPGSVGELLVSLAPPDPIFTLGPVVWAGGTSPGAAIPLAIPLLPAITGLTFYAQGALLETSGAQSLGLTNGLALTLESPNLPGLVLIQPGTFQMGSNAPSGPPYFGSSKELPVHQVTISRPFWMGRYEVTQAEYQALMGTNPAQYLGPNRPVERVTWNAAQAYCNALTAQQAALGKVPPGYQYRLPTEAEWEYACRAGTTTEYYLGTELFCNQQRIGFSEHSQSSCGISTNPAMPNSGHLPVGSFAPNPWGLHDMHGNVWEWCLDRGPYTYTAAAKIDPYNAGPSSSRMIRDGDFVVSTIFSRSANRDWQSAGVPFSAGGFRVVLAPIIAQ